MTLEHQPENRTFAKDAWRKANSIAGGHCMECYNGMIRSSDDPKDAVKFAIEMEAAAETPVDKSTAEFYQGQNLLRQAGTDKPKPSLLKAAHAALAKSIANDADDYGAYFLDGKALALLNRNTEASAAFQEFARRAPKNHALQTRAQNFAEHPELARMKMAPPVVVTTAAGKRFNLDNMDGRVVLIDFWATWCGPCNRELPHIQKLAKMFAGQPFEIISVSSDRDVTKWQSFIDSHAMTWNQYRDVDGSIGKAFAVNAIPHYFIIDSDGALTSEDIGTDTNIDAKLKKLVKHAADSGAKSASEIASLQ